MSATRRLLQVVAFVATLVIGVASMAIIVTQMTWFKEWLRGFIVQQAESYVNGQVSIGRLSGTLFTGIELQDVSITMNGRTVVSIEEVELDYNALTFVRGDVVLEQIRLEEPHVRLVKTAQGWNLARLLNARTPDPDEPKTRPTIEIGEIRIDDGSIALENVSVNGIDVPARIERIDASIGVTSNKDALTIDVANLSLRTEDPQFRIEALSGVIRRTASDVRVQQLSLRTAESALQIDGAIRNIESETPTLDIRVSSNRLALGEIAALVPALRGYVLQPAFEISAMGPVDRLALSVNVREPSVGQVSGDLVVDALAPVPAISGALAVKSLDLAPIAMKEALRSDITGTVRFDLVLPGEGLPMSGTYAVNADRAAIGGYRARDVVANGRIDDGIISVNASANAYGGRATTRGTVRIGEPLALDLSGTVAGVDLRNLPASLQVPAVPSHLQFAYTLMGRGSAFSGTARLSESTVAGATIEAGTTAQFSVGRGAPTYAVQGEVADVNLQAIGQAFAIAALADDRFESAINARVDVQGSGGGRDPLVLDATGTVTDSSVFGARVPMLAFTAAISDGDAHVTAMGRFMDVNPASITGNQRIAGDLDGAIDLDATLHDYAAGVTPDSIDVAGRVSLGPSRVAELAIDAAVIEGRYADRAGTIARLSIEGPDLIATAQGPIVLDDTGQSNLTIHVETPSLARIGEIVGQPLTGSAIVDATITGNAAELVARGTLTGSNLGYGDANALSLTSTFDVSVPELDFASTTVDATTSAAFVQIAGQQITQINADVAYADSQLSVSAMAQQEMRQVQVGGTVTLHPDHQEIHLPSLVLRSGAIEWRIAPDSAAAIQYGRDRIAVQDVVLVSGNQRITADGVWGSPTETLTVTASNVDVAELSQLALDRSGRIAGRLDATAMISGSTSDPNVVGEFLLTQGAFDAFLFDSFGGSVEHADRGLMLDVTLQQTPGAWITAKGFAPTTLFRGNPVDVAQQHRAPSAGDRVDIQVTSSQIGLGVVQGFTSAVTNVGGSLQANFAVTGSGYDPHLIGDITIRDGSFDVPALGTSYTGLDTRIDLRPDAIEIARMRIVDTSDNVLTIGGSLAVHPDAAGGVDVTLEAEDFKVLDNEIGELRLDTDLRLTGTLRQPRIEGSVDVSTGTIDVAEVLARVTSDAYATDATVRPVENVESAVELVRRNAEIPAESDSALPAGGADTVPGTTGVAPEGSADVDAADTASPSTSLFDALALDISMSVPDDLVLTGQDLSTGGGGVSLGDVNLTVGGMIRIRKSPGEPVRLIGDVNTVRGSYTFQGRRFEIMRDGRIRFVGTTPIDPLLDIEARRVIAGVEAFVEVGGSLREPELSFRSNPPLEEADILSLIVFNQPVNELGAGQQASLAQRAGALATGYLASGLAQSIGSALNLSEFEIRAAGENGAGPSIALGEQIGQDLFVRLSQGFGSASVTEFILEYQISQLLRLRATVAQAPSGTERVRFRRVERGGIDLIFFFAY